LPVLGAHCCFALPPFEGPAGRVVVDILDPHHTGLADAAAKAVGLAQYAAKHADKFGRIELIIVVGDNVKRLDLKDEVVREKVKLVTTREQLERLYEEEGNVA
jgi:type III restriction enzyme